MYYVNNIIKNFIIEFYFDNIYCYFDYHSIFLNLFLLYLKDV